MLRSLRFHGYETRGHREAKAVLRLDCSSLRPSGPGGSDPGELPHARRSCEIHLGWCVIGGCDAAPFCLKNRLIYDALHNRTLLFADEIDSFLIRFFLYFVNFNLSVFSNPSLSFHSLVVVINFQLCVDSD